MILSTTETASHTYKSKNSSTGFGGDDAIIVALTLLTLFVYADVLKFDFVAYDDGIYVTDNARIKNGLSWNNIVWAFTSFYDSNWFPITLISHMADVELFGLRAGLHHMNNVFIHTANSILLFLLFRRLTGSRWMSAFVAATFAIHPVHVESVAWVSERKDVLSAFFWLAALLSYVRYVRRSSAGNYLILAALFILALMSKPMPVTLPFALLLLDYWPLGRISGISTGPQIYEMRSLKALIMEKVPLFIISLISSAVTLAAQSSGGAVVSLQKLPFIFRLENAALSYSKYLFNTIFPYNLTILYPMPTEIPALHAWAAASIIILISVAAFQKARKFPYLLTGWFWFIGTLVPTIGLVAVGQQAMADRYNYMPSVGLFVIAAAALMALLTKRAHRTLAILLIVALLSICTRKQLQYWQTSKTLFQRAIDVTERNKTAYYDLGMVYAAMRNYPEAVQCYESALRIRPDDCDTLHNLGLALMDSGHSDEAAARFKKAIEINPRYAKSYVAYGNILISQNRLAEAMVQFNKAMEINPLMPSAINGAGVVMALTDDPEGAVKMFDRALSLKPDYAEADRNKQGALALIAKRPEGGHK
ncbi:MAG: tetratricopeptide repeat protein [Candidatus Magnetominusculus sp. LBB02]|nr:tetratricopeptide repeat protein [Candidatus Magnetominusculus sp. LBB02]